MELLAQVVEINSVIAAEQKLTKAVTVPRPAHIKAQARAAANGIEYSGDAYKNAIGVLQASSGKALIR